MSASTSLAAIAALAVVVTLNAHAAADPIEPIPKTTSPFCRIKSPGQQMHFTAGLPFRMLADGIDPGGYQWLSGRNQAKEVRFYVDGKVVATAPQRTDAINHFEARLPAGLTVGAHTLTVQSTNYGEKIEEGLVPVSILVDPMPVRSRTVELSADLVLSGSVDLDWQDAKVIGNGHRVTSTPGWSGKVNIRGAFVTGLGGFTEKGIDVTTTSAVVISDSIFEATGAMYVTTQGAADVTVKDNELRASNYVTYVASDPGKSPIIELAGNTTGKKVFAGNRVAGGIVRIVSMNGFVVGGDDDAASNILIGPRCVIDISNSKGAVIRGNYMHHDYQGGWSQGFNLYMYGSDGALAEHNVIRDSSWPVQSFGGEFRYNLVVNSGHDWFRSAANGAKFHHNVIVHAAGPDSSFNGGFLFYSKEQSIAIYNNTFDAGGATSQFGAPVVAAGSGVAVASVRNNVVTGFSEVGSAFDGALFAHKLDEKGSTGARFLSADYNAFFNPLAPKTLAYGVGMVTGTPGTHDVKADPMFAMGSEIPYAVQEGDVWNRRYGVSQVLARYRARYMPKAGSPLVDKGDPADGAGTDIGAIEGDSGASRPEDRFGKFTAKTDDAAPTVRITAPTAGTTLGRSIALAAQAEDDVGVNVVQFYVNDKLVGEDGTAPYAIEIDGCTLPDGALTVRARAWDVAGNSADSAAVAATVHATGCASPPPPPPETDAGAPPGAIDDAGNPISNVTDPERSPEAAGCTCSTTRRGRTAPLSIALVVALVALPSVRRRRSR